MAVSDSGAQIWNPHDLMTGEQAIFKQVKFYRICKLDHSDDWLYEQESRIKMPEVYSMTGKEATELVASHKKNYNYSPEIEAEMVRIGQIIKAHEGESAYNFLTRLYQLAGTMVQQKATKALEMEQMKLQQQYKAAQSQVYEQMQQKLAQYDAGQLKPSWWNDSYSSQTNAVPHYSFTNITTHTTEAVPALVQPEVEPTVETRVPDPVEPKKRLMKRNI